MNMNSTAESEISAICFGPHTRKIRSSGQPDRSKLLKARGKHIHNVKQTLFSQLLINYGCSHRHRQCFLRGQSFSHSLSRYLLLQPFNTATNMSMFSNAFIRTTSRRIASTAATTSSSTRAASTTVAQTLFRGQGAGEAASEARRGFFPVLAAAAAGCLGVAAYGQEEVRCNLELQCRFFGTIATR